MRDVVGDSEKCAIVSLYELLESSYIPILAGMDKIQVIVCYCPRCELCRLWSHIGSERFGEQQGCGTNLGCPERKVVSAAMPSRSRGLTAPRLSRSSSGGPSRSRDTFPPW